MWQAQQRHPNSGRQGSSSWHRALRSQALPHHLQAPTRRAGTEHPGGTRLASVSTAPSHSLRM